MKKKLAFRPKGKVLLLGFISLLLFSACAEQVPIDACTEGEPYGFWYGIMHGVIAPIAFIISLFEKDVAIYAIHNNGAWYNLGFLFGISITMGGTGKSVSHSKKKPKNEHNYESQ